jgi:hypothetical protein
MSGPPPRATTDTSALDTESLPRLSWPASKEELSAYVTASRAAQGLPSVVTDPAALERVAAVLRLVSLPEPAPAPHGVPAALKQDQGAAR